MTKKTIINSFSIAGFIFLLLACTDSSNEEINITNGTYEYAVCVQSYNEKATTKVEEGAMNNGTFTNAYTNDYIYLHSYDENEETDKWVRYDFTDETTCTNGKGFHLNVTVDGDTYTVKGTDEHGQEKTITFNAGDQVYFSSTQDETWEGKQSTASPIRNQTVLVRDENEANKEILYRSDNYNIEDLVTGKGGMAEGILMRRKCSAFIVYFLFTDFDVYGGQIPTETLWERETGTQIEDWKGKMYLGPCFADQYDLEKQAASYTQNRTDGYYASWNQEYTAFQMVSFNGGSIPGQEDLTYQGAGIQTSNDFLITPYDLTHDGNMKFYAFLKYQGTSDDTSDEGAKYFEYEIKLPVPEFNTTNYYVIVCDIDDLAAFTQGTANTTRSITVPQKIDLQPIKVLHFQE